MWQKRDGALYKLFTFKDFNEAFAFMEKVAKIANFAQHHPRWTNEWNKVELWLSTHEKGGTVTEKDEDLARAIDAILAPAKDKAEPVAPKIRLDKIIIYADGGSRGNPGPSASGYILMDADQNVLADKGVYLGITTNNQAEYQALKFGLEEAQKMQIERVDVYMDSLLVINQMKGIFKVKNRDLWPIHDAIQQLIKKSFNQVTFTHIPRELNKLADGAVNRVLDETLGLTA